MGGLLCPTPEGRADDTAETRRYNAFASHGSIEVRIHDTTVRVRHFYEQTPFPNYDDLETPAELVSKAQRGTLASLLDRDIPFQVRVLDIGCGTGQLPLYLSLASRRVVGADLSRASLGLGEDFRRRNGLSSIQFVQCDLFRVPFPPGT